MTEVGTLLAGTGSAVGAVARYSVGRAVSRVSRTDFPWGTWLINLAGTLLLGLCVQELTVFHSFPNWYILIGTGFCGGFTTFSTMSVEAVQLFRTRFILGVVYLGSSLALGFVLAWVTHLLL